jgi:hypothetical protein
MKPKWPGLWFARIRRVRAVFAGNARARLDVSTVFNNPAGMTCLMAHRSRSAAQSYFLICTLTQRTVLGTAIPPDNSRKIGQAVGTPISMASSILAIGSKPVSASPCRLATRSTIRRLVRRYVNIKIGLERRYQSQYRVSTDGSLLHRGGVSLQYLKLDLSALSRSFDLRPARGRDLSAPDR